MSINSASSTISLAEEVTEVLYNLETKEEIYNNFEKLDNSNLFRIPNIITDNKFKQNNTCTTESSDNDIKYEPIKPDHIHIINLQVDYQLKPYHLLINKKNYWCNSDPAFDEKRRKSIVQYLVNDNQSEVENFQKRERFNSMTNSKPLDNKSKFVRCSSLNDMFAGRCGESEDILSETTIETEDHIMTDRRNSLEEEYKSMNDIMAHLDFQVNRRNERSHFILSELLIQTIEYLYSDELLYRSSNSCTSTNPPEALVNTSLIDSDSLLNVMSFRSHYARVDSQSMLESSTTAETIAVIIIEEIMHSSPFINVHNHFKRGYPPSLPLLLQRLEKQCEFSSGEKSQTVNKYYNIQESNFYEHKNISEEADEKIRAVVESCHFPLNIPVGEYPIMSPSQCLPTYVVTKNHISVNQASTLKMQNNECPGCHNSFSFEMAKRLRLCRYYEYYFCSICHNNTLMLIPSRILSNWDFTMLPVSCVARDLLKLIHSESLFSINNFSEKLRLSLHVLTVVKRLRWQGRLFVDFIETCRQSHSLKYRSDKFPPHWLSKGEQKFSISDFQLMESGVMVQELKSFASSCVEHISICPLCQAHGFLCEHCDNKSDVIFPFEIDKVYQCKDCRACSHVSCHDRLKNYPCPRCERRRIRQQLITNAS